MSVTLLGTVPSIPIYGVSQMLLDGFVDALTPPQKNWISEMNFKAGLGQFVMLCDDSGFVERVIFGLGDARAQLRNRLIFGTLHNTLPPGNYHLVPSHEYDLELAVLGWLLGSYRFDKFKSGPSAEFPKLVTPAGIDKERLTSIAQSCHLAQELINRPANDLTTTELAMASNKIASKYKATISVISDDDLITKNFPLIHAVGRASEQSPMLIDMKWGEASNPMITLVGKGVCYDTGGLDIKPSASMKLMKKDMGGAANVLGLAQMIMEAKLPVRLRVLVPAVENAISGNAFRSGDILTARNGKTVEINNTDAEGRLVLADALTYAAEENPELIVSMATLTGAARVAVGPDIVPFFTDSEEASADLMRHSTEQQDPMWRLPFWNPYEDLIEPAAADLDNAPAGGMAGAITAALFLRRFVDRKPYLHCDLYGWTPSAKPGRPQGGAAQGIRAIFAMLSEKYGG